MLKIMSKKIFTIVLENFSSFKPVAGIRSMGRFTFLYSPDALNHYFQDPHMTLAARGTLNTNKL